MASPTRACRWLFKARKPQPRLHLQRIPFSTVFVRLPQIFRGHSVLTGIGIRASLNLLAMLESNGFREEANATIEAAQESHRFLIATPRNRNRRNSLKTKHGDKF
jgi:hypothetical protein